MDPTASILRADQRRARAAQARMIFAEGDDPRVLRAAVMYQRNGFGKALVVGREDDVKAKLKPRAGRCGARARGRERRQHPHLETYKDFLYPSAAQGLRPQDIHRLAARDRHVFSALMLAHGMAMGWSPGRRANRRMCWN
jgi:malate dehydrogenase (oxaloacetate-decarboxylating)(NADP+)